MSGPGFCKTNPPRPTQTQNRQGKDTQPASCLTGTGKIPEGAGEGKPSIASPSPSPPAPDLFPEDPVLVRVVFSYIPSWHPVGEGRQRRKAVFYGRTAKAEAEAFAYKVRDLVRYPKLTLERIPL